MLYRGNYKWLIVIPLLFLAAAMYFIPQIQLGREFRGGLIISATFDHEVDLPITGEVRKIKSPSGVLYEITMDMPPEIARLDAMRNAFYANLTAYRQMLAQGENVSDDAVFEAARPLLEEAGMPMPTSLNQLERDVSIAYSKLFSRAVSSIEDKFRGLPGFRSISVEVIGPILSERLMQDGVKVVIFSLLLSAAVVFVYFRKFVPALAVIAGAVADLIFGLGAMGLFKITLSLHALAALLMLLGFSLDTDILLTSKVLSGGDPRKNAEEAMSTGLVMSGTTLLAFVILTIAGYLTRIPIYYDMGLIASVGLIGDLIFTWLFNAVIVLWVMEK